MTDTETIIIDSDLVTLLKQLVIPADIRSNEPRLAGDTGTIHMGAEDFHYTVKVIADDRDTLAEIYSDIEPDEPIGIGYARRRKGERRNNALGVALALARAFQDASDGYAGQAKALLR